LDRTLEYDIITALENATLEEISNFMNEIDAGNFTCADEMSKQRIKSRTLRMMGVESDKGNKEITKKAKRSHAVLKSIIGMAASFAILLTTVCTFNVQAREFVRKMFAFIPGVGVVENYEDIYVLSEPVVCAENEDILIEINRAIVEDGYITLEYKATMKKVDIDKVNYFVLEEDPITALLDYYASFGYDKYFELDHDLNMTAYSSLEIQGQQLSRVETDTFFNELSGMKDALITEKYDMNGLTIDDVRNAKLTLGTLSLEFSLDVAQVFYTEDQALDGKMVCERNGIELVCETKWINNTLVAAFYTVKEDGVKVYTLFPYYLSENAGVFLDINGRCVEGQIANNEVNMDSVVFWLNEEDLNQPCTITIPVIAVIEPGASDGDEYIMDGNFIFEVE